MKSPPSAHQKPDIVVSHSTRYTLELTRNSAPVVTMFTVPIKQIKL